MIYSEFPISTVCSLQFVAVNRINMKDEAYVHRVVWTINDVDFISGSECN